MRGGLDGPTRGTAPRSGLRRPQEAGPTLARAPCCHGDCAGGPSGGGSSRAVTAACLGLQWRASRAERRFGDRECRGSRDACWSRWVGVVLGVKCSRRGAVSRVPARSTSGWARRGLGAARPGTRPFFRRGRFDSLTYLCCVPMICAAHTPTRRDGPPAVRVLRRLNRNGRWCFKGWPKWIESS